MLQSRQVYGAVAYSNKSSQHHNKNTMSQSTLDSEFRLDLLKTFNNMNVTLSLATCEMDDAVSSLSSTHHYGDNTISNNNNDNNHEDDNPHKCSGLDDSITYTVNASNTTTDINNNNNNPHKRTQHRLFIGKEKIRNFFISYEFWIFIVPLLITVIFVIFLSISFGYAFISNSSKVDEDKEPCGSQIISYKKNETINKICLEPIETGPCRAAIPMFAFNKEEWRCTEFIYGGCHGTANRFLTLKECEAACH